MRLFVAIYLTSVLVATSAAMPALAATLSHDGVTITVPAPSGYKDVTARRNVPSYVALFEDAVLTVIVTRADTTGKMGRSVKRTGAQMRRSILKVAK